MDLAVIQAAAFRPCRLTGNPIKLETGSRPSSAGIPYTLLLRIEAMGFPTTGLLLYIFTPKNLYYMGFLWSLGLIGLRSDALKSLPWFQLGSVRVIVWSYRVFQVP